MATRAWAVIKKHVPLIKFRSRIPAVAVEEAAVPKEVVTPATPKNVTVQSFLLEDWQLAPKYKRKPLSPEEIECINGGGVY